jgi:hypothetical protein
LRNDGGHHQQSQQLANLEKDEEAITAAFNEFANLAAPYEAIKLTEDPDDIKAIQDAISYS